MTSKKVTFLLIGPPVLTDLLPLFDCLFLKSKASGKGTLCKWLLDDIPRLVYCSMGDLLRKIKSHQVKEIIDFGGRLKNIDPISCAHFSCSILRLGSGFASLRNDQALLRAKRKCFIRWLS